jgi:hypothetical protein
MKKLFISMAISGLALTLNAQGVYQIPNSDFETWASDKEPGNGWNSFNSAEGSLSSAKELSSAPVKNEGYNSAIAVKLTSKTVFGQKANGNLTTGTINMGSMTPANSSNYNFTNLDSEGHYLLFAGLPDAVECYAKFKSGGSPNGRGQFILHSKYEYRDPELEADAQYKLGIGTILIPATTEWTHYVAPFTYTGNELTEERYMLASFTTNPTPGGSANDELIVDDVKFLYYSQLASLSYDGNAIVGFDKDIYTYSVDAPFDATKLQAVADGKGAMIKTSYDAATGKCVVRVEGNDISANATNYHEYTIQFAVPVVTLFTNPLSVALDGTTMEPQETEIQLIEELDGSYTFVLNNFMFMGGGVGNIRVPNLNVEGNVFTADQTIQITEGDAEGVDEWMGPQLEDVPVKLKATRLSETEMVAVIDINIGMVIKVVFAPMVEINGTEEVPALNGLYNIKLSRPFVAGWNTVCLPFAYQTSVFGGDVKAQAFDSATEAGLNFVAVEDGVLAANTPYLINFPSATTMPVYFGVNIESTTPQSVTHGDFTFTGTYAAVTDMTGKYGVAKINGEDKITKGAAGSTLKATRAYFTTSGADVQSVSLFFDGEATGIEAVETTGEKAFDVYTISGVQVRRAAKTLDGLQKGIYIVNGKKQVVK